MSGSHQGSQGQANASGNEGQDPGPSGVGPSSLPNINTSANEEMMDMLELFGFKNPLDDEGESGPGGGPESPWGMWVTVGLFTT